MQKQQEAMRKKQNGKQQQNWRNTEKRIKKQQKTKNRIIGASCASIN